MLVQQVSTLTAISVKQKSPVAFVPDVPAHVAPGVFTFQPKLFGTLNTKTGKKVDHGTIGVNTQGTFERVGGSDWRLQEVETLLATKC